MTAAARWVPSSGPAVRSSATDHAGVVAWRMAFWDFLRRKQPRTDSGVGLIPDSSLTGQARADEWLNIITGQGYKGRDKRTAAQFVCEPISHEEARHLWRGDDIAKKVIESLPKAMIREGYTIKTDDKEEMSRISKSLRKLNRAFLRAKMYEIAYGGSAIWPVINDGAGNPAEPLREQSIAKLVSWQVFEPRELQPATWYTDPLHEKYGTPETYRVVAITSGGAGFALTTTIHESRLIIFPGVMVSREYPQVETWGWGDSRLTLIRSVLRDFHLTWASVAALLADFSQGVFKYRGLTDMLVKKQDEIVKKKMALMDYSRSTMQALTIDADDDFERKSTPMSGAPEVLVNFTSRLAAAANMPVTKLMGVSPAGLNATGDSDTRGWYETVAEEQEADRELFEHAVRLVLLSKSGPTNGQEPKNWSLEFAPLWAPSAKEQAETRLIVAQTDQILVDTQQATGDELALSHFGGEEFSPDVHIDFAEREKQRKAGEAELAAGMLGSTGDVQAEALNGAQIAAAISIMEKVSAKLIPRDGAEVLVKLAFPTISEEVAKGLLGDPAFEPVVPAPKSNPFGPPAQPPAQPDQPAGDPPPGDKAAAA